MAEIKSFDDARRSVAAGEDVQAAAAALVAEMSQDERLWCLDGDAPFWAGLADLGSGGYHRTPFLAARLDRLGVPGFAFADGPRGVVVDRATCFPVSMARGATWDIDLEERIGAAIGRELRAVGATLFGGVCVNILRHPAWGRAQETYGEDPHHVGELGAALTRGVQRHAMACVKHFACNSMENARFRVDVQVDEKALHEVYLAHFKRIVDAGVAVVMSAYNRVNGDWCGESRALLTDILRDEWGFAGFVISDWIFGLRAAAPSVLAGMDVEMPYRMIRFTQLRAAIDAGEVGWQQIDGCVQNVVATLLRCDAVLRAPAADREVLACAAHRALAREAATKSIVLLRNEMVQGQPLLPLQRAALRSLAVLGQLATAVNLGDGGSSDVWAPTVVTIADGLRAALPEAEILVDSGSDPPAAARMAAVADAALVVVGYTYLDEGEYLGSSDTRKLSSLFPAPDDPDLQARFAKWVATGKQIEPPPHIAARASTGFATGGDRSSLRLHPQQVDLIRTVAAANRRTIVAIVAGSTVLTSEWDEQVPAVLQSWYAGMEGGHALADVLLGNADAGGRLPFSVPQHEEHLPKFDRDADVAVYDRWHGWWHLEHQRTAARYPFGFGLSYTDFRLSDPGVAIANGAVHLTAVLHNVGNRAGSDVVQVYARRDADGEPRRLVGFTRLELPAGTSRDVKISVPLMRLAERDTKAHCMKVLGGRYLFQVARHAADPAAELPVQLDPAL